jgi:hypothetical protein
MYSKAGCPVLKGYLKHALVVHGLACGRTQIGRYFAGLLSQLLFHPQLNSQPQGVQKSIRGSFVYSFCKRAFPPSIVSSSSDKAKSASELGHVMRYYNITKQAELMRLLFA